MSTNKDPAPQGEFLLYTTEDGHTRVECRFEDDSLWSISEVPDTWEFGAVVCSLVERLRPKPEFAVEPGARQARTPQLGARRARTPLGSGKLWGT